MSPSSHSAVADRRDPNSVPTSPISRTSGAQSKAAGPARARNDSVKRRDIVFLKADETFSVSSAATRDYKEDTANEKLPLRRCASVKASKSHGKACKTRRSLPNIAAPAPQSDKKDARGDVEEANKAIDEGRVWTWVEIQQNLAQEASAQHTENTTTLLFRQTTDFRSRSAEDIAIARLSFFIHRDATSIHGIAARRKVRAPSLTLKTPVEKALKAPQKWKEEYSGESPVLSVGELDLKKASDISGTTVFSPARAANSCKASSDLFSDTVSSDLKNEAETRSSLGMISSNGREEMQRDDVVALMKFRVLSDGREGSFDITASLFDQLSRDDLAQLCCEAVADPRSREQHSSCSSGDLQLFLVITYTLAESIGLRGPASDLSLVPIEGWTLTHAPSIQQLLLRKLFRTIAAADDCIRLFCLSQGSQAPGSLSASSRFWGGWTCFKIAWEGKIAPAGPKRVQRANAAAQTVPTLEADSSQASLPSVPLVQVCQSKKHIDESVVAEKTNELSKSGARARPPRPPRPLSVDISAGAVEQRRKLNSLKKGGGMEQQSLSNNTPLLQNNLKGSTESTKMRFPNIDSADRSAAKGEARQTDEGGQQLTMRKQDMSDCKIKPTPGAAKSRGGDLSDLSASDISKPLVEQSNIYYSSTSKSTSSTPRTHLHSLFLRPGKKIEGSPTRAIHGGAKDSLLNLSLEGEHKLQKILGPDLDLVLRQGHLTRKRLDGLCQGTTDPAPVPASLPTSGSKVGQKSGKTVNANRESRICDEQRFVEALALSVDRTAKAMSQRDLLQISNHASVEELIDEPDTKYSGRLKEHAASGDGAMSNAELVSSFDAPMSRRSNNSVRPRSMTNTQRALGKISWTRKRAMSDPVQPKIPRRRSSIGWRDEPSALEEMIFKKGNRSPHSLHGGVPTRAINLPHGQGMVTGREKVGSDTNIVRPPSAQSSHSQTGLQNGKHAASTSDSKISSRLFNRLLRRSTIGKNASAKHHSRNGPPSITSDDAIVCICKTPQTAFRDETRAVLSPPGWTRMDENAIPHLRETVAHLSGMYRRTSLSASQPEFVNGLSRLSPIEGWHHFCGPRSAPANKTPLLSRASSFGSKSLPARDTIYSLKKDLSESSILDQAADKGRPVRTTLDSLCARSKMAPAMKADIRSKTEALALLSSPSPLLENAFEVEHHRATVFESSNSRNSLTPTRLWQLTQNTLAGPMDAAESVIL